MDPVPGAKSGEEPGVKPGVEFGPNEPIQDRIERTTRSVRSFFTFSQIRCFRGKDGFAVSHTDSK